MARTVVSLKEQSLVSGVNRAKTLEFPKKYESNHYLSENSRAYEWKVQETLGRGHDKNAEKWMAAVRDVARFAVRYHPGRYADGRLENILLEIGQSIKFPQGLSASAQNAEHGPGKRVLHVASSVSETGGHTRMIDRWITSDKSSRHSVALIHQSTSDAPRWLVESIHNSGGSIFSFDTVAKLGDKAAALRSVCQRAADMVMLHCDPFDVVPVVALASSRCPPVALVNHADHLFWLGTSIADTVVSIRSIGAENAIERRQCKSSCILPVPLIDKAVSDSRRGIREKLNISDDTVLLVSIGRPEKYRPCGEFNFFNTVGRILDRHADAAVVIVGASTEEMSPFLQQDAVKRLHLVGQQDPTPYLAAADVYMESFPFGSQTALLEAALTGLPVVCAYEPLTQLLVTNDDPIEKHLLPMKTEAEYVNRVSSYILSSEQRCRDGLELRRAMLDSHTGSGWTTRLEELYEKLRHRRHAPGPIKPSVCESTQDDIGSAVWRALGSETKFSSQTGDDCELNKIRYSAFVFKEAGNLQEARQWAFSSVCRNPFGKVSLRLLMSVYFAKVMRFFRKYESRRKAN